MKSYDEHANGLRWRLQAMRRLWSAAAKPEMTFLALQPLELDALGELDHPLPGAEIEGATLTVSGWVAFTRSPVSRVEVWLDEELVGRARLGLLRPDIAELHDIDFAAVSGFEMIVDFDHPHPRGEKRLRVVATAVDGRAHVVEATSILVTEELASGPALSSPPAPITPRAATRTGLKTLVATHQLNLGGAQLYLMDLLRGLRERGGIEPTVVSAMDGPLREELEAMGIPVHITSVSPHDDLSSHLGHVEEMAAWAEPFGFEVAFVNTATALSFPGAEVAARLCIPAVWAIHESFEPAVLWASLDDEVRERAETALSGAAFAIFEADATQRIFEPLLDSSRCRMLPYGLDLAPIDAKRADFDAVLARLEAGLPAGARVVVCIGTVEARKAQIPLAQAFGQIAGRHPEAHLAFVGGRKDDPNSVALEKCIESSPQRDQMRLIPITPDVDPWYGMADLLVCASDIESLPRTVLEAMAWETPVLATEVFGLPELIDEGETGWLCEPRDVAELAAELDRALSASPEQAQRIGRASRQLVQRRHDLGNYAREVADLLERAVRDTADTPQADVAPG